jgi:hypothetical protein
MRIIFKKQDLGEWRGAPRLKEARTVKHRLGMLPEEFNDAITRMDPDALCMLISLLKYRNGEQVSYEEIDGEYEDFDVQLSEEEKKQAAEQEAGGISPVIVGILRELKVDVDAFGVSEVVLRHVEAAAKAQAEQGKGVEPEPGPVLETGTTNGSPNSSMSTTSRETSSNESTPTSTTTPLDGGRTSGSLSSI